MKRRNFLETRVTPLAATLSIVIVGLLTLLWVSGNAAEAQSYRRSLPVNVPLPSVLFTVTPHLDSVPDSTHWMTITTDTGDLAPGHREFTRYTTVLQCLTAANTERAYQRHTLTIQAAASVLQHTASEQDTLPRSVALVARTCGARFSPRTTPEQDLPDLWQLELLARNDSAARTVERRLVAVTPLGPQRFTRMAAFVHYYLEQEPARVAVAESLVAQLAASGSTAQTAFDQGNSALLRFFDTHHNPVAMQAAAEQRIAFTHTLQSHDTSFENCLNDLIDFRTAWVALMEIAYHDHPDSISAIIQRIQQEYRQPGVQGLLHRIPRFYHGDPPSRWTVTDIKREFAPLVKLEGEDRQELPVRADYWFLGPEGGDSSMPKPGVISFVVEFPSECLAYAGDEQSDEDCTVLTQHLRRIEHQYGAAGLKITVVARTRGHSIFSGPQTPLEEARTIAWYVHDYLHLPITVAVERTTLKRLPTPDGRLVEDTLALPLAPSNGKRFKWSDRVEHPFHLFIGAAEYRTGGWFAVDRRIDLLLQSHPVSLVVPSEAPAPVASSSSP